ncbi:MAG: glycerol-3-phosphate 1-O-acyltransferase PlsY [Brevinema sp.]
MQEIISNTTIMGILLSVLGFLLGSIPFGLIYGLMRGVDIRNAGSGNIGATNVGRQFGFWQGMLPIMILDMAKGMVAIFIFRSLFDIDISSYDFFQILIGFSAVLGHVFSPWMRFKGGKGVATTGGIVFVLAPIVMILSLALFLLVFFTFGKKIIGRASVVTGICFPLIVFFNPNTSQEFQITAFILSILLIFAHKKNIKAWISNEDLRQKQEENKNK